MTIRVSASFNVASWTPLSPHPSPVPGSQKDQSRRKNTPGEVKDFKVVFPGSGHLMHHWTLSIRTPFHLGVILQSLGLDGKED